ncbi:MAG: FAD-binding oxidoreductase [Planctomycetota bacterium]|jgi:Na+-transporting NADH:ubiquinone oxidoreductase subunit F
MTTLADIQPFAPWLVVLVAAGVTCAVSVVLAALLLVAEKVLVNYGTCTVDINDGGRQLEVDGGETLLATLKGQSIFIPSACGGRGTCAYCKLKVLEGGGPLLPTEEPLLTAEEIADDIRISCQLKVRNDLKIEIPEELFAIREYRGTVEQIRDLTHDIKELRIALTDPPEIDFAAGQYIQLESPPYGGNPDPVYRAYSMSNSPYDHRHIETIIRRVPGGICTTWVFEHLAEGDAVTLNGPYGEFRLSDTDNPMVWIAGGSGMSPFWSMVRHMQQASIERKTTYFFGAVSERDLFFIEELAALSKELPWFEFIPALSGPAAEDHWTGETGLITEVVDRHLPADTANLEGYLCGSAGMIDAAVKVLVAKGLTEDHIFYDKFN